MNKQKILLVPGHCISGDMGAYSNHLQIFEQKYNVLVANYLRMKYPLNYDVYLHSVNGYNMRQTALAGFANKLNYKSVIELHFNASEKHTAQGTETLYFHKSVKGKQYAQIMNDEIVREYGLKDRGVKPISGGNGFGFLQKMKAVALIVEPFFGDEEKCIIFENIPRYGDTLHKAFKQL